MKILKPIIIILATIFFLTLSTWIMFSSHGMTESAVAEIIDIKYVQEGYGDMYYPVLKYQVNGKTYTHVDSTETSTNVIGKIVDIHYDKNNPTRVVTNVNRKAGKGILFTMIYPMALFFMIGFLSPDRNKEDDEVDIDEDDEIFIF